MTQCDDYYQHLRIQQAVKIPTDLFCEPKSSKGGGGGEVSTQGFNFLFFAHYK